MEEKLMTIRCDYCRGKFGLIVHRYWRMRFCSAVCAQAYEQRLHHETKAKIRDLADTSTAKPVAKPPGLGTRLVADTFRHLGG
jgi:hypothetical protein